VKEDEGFFALCFFLAIVGVGQGGGTGGGRVIFTLLTCMYCSIIFI